MAFPLKQRKLIRGATAHVAAGLGIGADYIANYTELFIPFDGKVECYWGAEGGNWVRLTRSNGDRIEMAHNSEFKINNGQAHKNALAAITGNTGAITTGPHCHIQIFNKLGIRLDPEMYNWEDTMNQSKVVLSKDGKTVYVCYPMPSEEYLKSNSELEGYSIPSPIPPSSDL